MLSGGWQAIFIAFNNRILYSSRMNKTAQALGRLARGVPKNYSQAERKRRAAWAKEMTRRRVVATSKAANRPAVSA
jgi:hypothetical protein